MAGALEWIVRANAKVSIASGAHTLLPRLYTALRVFPM